MTDALDHLADVIGKNISQSPRGIAYAVIDALPDMVLPLEWHPVDQITKGCISLFGQRYTIWSIDGFGYCKFPGTHAGERFLGGMEAAKAAAEAHYRAQILAAFKLGEQP